MKSALDCRSTASAAASRDAYGAELQDGAGFEPPQLGGGFVTATDCGARDGQEASHNLTFSTDQS